MSRDLPAYLAHRDEQRCRNLLGYVALSSLGIAVNLFLIWIATR